MDSNEKEISIRKDKIVSFFKDPYKVALIVILLFALGVRIHYYNISHTQPLWYDESEYMTTAQSWAYGIPFEYNVHRPPLFQFLAALAFMIGLGENFIRIFLVLLPSFLFVFAVYLLGKEMFDKKVGLVAALLTSVSWTLLFWGARIQPDYFSILFQTLSIYFMWRYWKKPENKPIILAGIFAALGFHFKVSGLLVPMSFALFIFIKDRLSAFKNKHYYYFLIAFLLTLLPYFIWSQMTFGTPTAFREGYSSAVENSTPFAFKQVFGMFGPLTAGILYLLFVIGFIYSLRFLLYSDILIKNREKCFDPRIFSIVVLVVVTAFYVFYIRSIEDRWVFLWLPFIFFMIGESLSLIYDFTKKYNKIIAIMLVGGLLLWGAKVQLNQAESLIEGKKNSYIQIKEAALWMKSNSERGDKILSVSLPQTQYYSERETKHYSLVSGPEEMDKFILEFKPKFIEISILEPNHPTWILQVGSYPSGRLNYIAIPYLNSTIILNEDGTIKAVGLQSQFKRGEITFSYAYPKDTLNGVFIYEINYPEEKLQNNQFSFG